MDFLTIDGTPWPVLSSDGADLELVKVGGAERAFAGNLRSIRNDQFLEAKAWRIGPVSKALAAVFYNLDDGDFHDISGEAFGLAPLTGLIDIASAKLVRNGMDFDVLFTVNLRTT